MEANRLFTHRFTADRDHDDPFNTITLDVLFTNPESKQKLAKQKQTQKAAGNVKRHPPNSIGCCCLKHNH